MQVGLNSFIASDFLTLKVDTQPHAQLRTYGACLRDHADKHNWMAFFDIDEFLALRTRCAHLNPATPSRSHVFPFDAHCVMILFMRPYSILP